MTLPQKFRKPRSTTPLSYNYQDIIQGTGVTIFFALIGSDSNGTNHILSQEKLFSESIESTTSTSSTNFTTIFEQTFSLTSFNISRIVKLDEIVICGMNTGAVGGTTTTVKVTATLIKTDAGGDTTV